MKRWMPCARPSRSSIERPARSGPHAPGVARSLTHRPTPFERRSRGWLADGVRDELDDGLTAAVRWTRRERLVVGIDTTLEMAERLELAEH